VERIVRTPRSRATPNGRRVKNRAHSTDGVRVNKQKPPTALPGLMTDRSGTIFVVFERQMPGNETNGFCFETGEMKIISNKMLKNRRVQSQRLQRVLCVSTVPFMNSDKNCFINTALTES